MFNTRQILADVLLSSSGNQQNELLMEFIQVSARPDSTPTMLEQRLLTSLVFASRAHQRAN